MARSLAQIETWFQYVKRLRYIPKEVINDVKPRLPAHYLSCYELECKREPENVFLKEHPDKYYVDEFERLKSTKSLNHPVKVIFPIEADLGLWGGVGYVQGYVLRTPNRWLRMHSCKVWKPMLTTRVFHSPLLNKHMAITVSFRTLDLVDKAYGFDNYILQTHNVDLRSLLGRRLKREMLMELARKHEGLQPCSVSDDLFQQYHQYVMPFKEAEWFGLTIAEAVLKQLQLEEGQLAIEPWKNQLAKELRSRLQTGADTTDFQCNLPDAGAEKSVIRKYVNKIAQ